MFKTENLETWMINLGKCCIGGLANITSLKKMSKVEEWKAWRNSGGSTKPGCFLSVPKTPKGSSIGDTWGFWSTPPATTAASFPFANSPSVIAYFAKDTSTSLKHDWAHYQFILQRLPDIHGASASKRGEVPSWLQSWTLARHNNHALGH